MGAVAKLSFSLLIAVVFFVSLTSCQNFTYVVQRAISGNWIPFMYHLDGSDQPSGQPPKYHIRTAVETLFGVGSAQAYRFNTTDPSCINPLDCSVPIKFPNPKDVSVNLTSIVPPVTQNPRGVNQFHMSFAQLANHDIGRYTPAAPLANQTYYMEWPMPQTDPGFIWNQTSTSGVEITKHGVFNMTWDLKRNIPAAGTGNGTGKPQNTQTTSPIWWDLDPIYGTTQAAGSTRYNQTTGDMTLDSDGLSAGQSFLQPLAPMMFTIFVREHNWYAAQLRAELANTMNGTSPATMNGTAIWYYARRWTIACYQAIVFYEYAPIIFNGPMDIYAGHYDDPNFGVPIEVPMLVHYPYSEFPAGLYILDSNFEEITTAVPYRGAFGNTNKQRLMIRNWGFESIIRGAIMGHQENVDLYFSEGLRVLGVNGQISSDAVARMIARSRDQGTPSYNDLRQAYNMTRITNFGQLSPNLLPAHRLALEQLYNNNTDLLDFFVGYHGEWTNTTHMGPLATTIYRAYWHSVRRNDKWWFESTNNPFTPDELSVLQQMKISTLLLKHFNLAAVPCSSFYSRVPDCPPAPLASCAGSGNPNLIQVANSQITLTWLNMTTGSNTATFTLSAPTTGFIAMGFPSTPGRMLGADVFVGNVWDSNGTVTVVPHHVSAKAPCTGGVGVCPLYGKYNVTVISGTQTSTNTTITFTVSPVTPSSNFSIISSFGQTDQLAYHGANKGVGTIALLVGSSTSAPTPNPCTCPASTCPPTTSCPAPSSCPAVSTCPAQTSCTPAPTCPACTCNIRVCGNSALRAGLFSVLSLLVCVLFAFF